MEKKTEVLLRLREFLMEDRLCMTVCLEKGDFGDSHYSASIDLEEQALGHFRFATADLEAMAANAGKIAELAGSLRRACLAALENDLQRRLEREG